MIERKSWAEGHSVEHSAKIFLAECSTAFRIGHRRKYTRCGAVFPGVPPSLCLPYGVAVVDRSRPEVPDQGEANAPGDGEDRAVADRGAQQQPPQRVDDRREGLVLGEPAYPGWH